MTFLVALMLVDRGELDFNARVSDYWPSSRRTGSRTLRFVTSWVTPLVCPADGAPSAGRPRRLDWCTSMLAAQKRVDTGTASGYHS